MNPIVKIALVPAILATSIVAADVLAPRAVHAQVQDIPVTEAIATNTALETATTLEHHRGHRGHHRRRRRRILRHLFH